MAEIAIASLSSDALPPLGASIRAVVSLSWPYSSSTQQCALLLADPDFRHRNSKGQVRVRFTGPSAQAVANSRVGIGDAVVLGLDGAAWAQNVEVTTTPGRSVDGELVYRSRLVLTISSLDGQTATVHVDALSPAPEGSSTAEELLTPRPLSLNRTWTPLGGAEGIYSSPAFAKRLRLSGEYSIDSAYDPFVSDEWRAEHVRKKSRTSWGGASQWRYAEQTPPPADPLYELDYASDEEYLSRSLHPAAAMVDIPPPLPQFDGPRDDDMLIPDREAASGHRSMLPPPLPLLKVSQSSSNNDRYTQAFEGGKVADPFTPRLQPVASSALPPPPPISADLNHSQTRAFTSLQIAQADQTSRAASRESGKLALSGEIEPVMDIPMKSTSPEETELRTRKISNELEKDRIRDLDMEERDYAQDSREHEARARVLIEQEPCDESRLATSHDGDRSSDDQDLDHGEVDVVSSGASEISRHTTDESRDAVEMLLPTTEALVSEVEQVVREGERNGWANKGSPEELEASPGFGTWPRTPGRAIPKTLPPGPTSSSRSYTGKGSVHSAPRSEKQQTIMAETFRSLFGFESVGHLGVEAFVPRSPLPDPIAAEIAPGETEDVQDRRASSPEVLMKETPPADMHGQAIEVPAAGSTVRERSMSQELELSLQAPTSSETTLAVQTSGSPDWVPSLLEDILPKDEVISDVAAHELQRYMTQTVSSPAGDDGDADDRHAIVSQLESVSGLQSVPGQSTAVPLSVEKELSEVFVQEILKTMPAQQSFLSSPVVVDTTQRDTLRSLFGFASPEPQGVQMDSFETESLIMASSHWPLPEFEISNSMPETSVAEQDSRTMAISMSPTASHHLDATTEDMDPTAVYESRSDDPLELSTFSTEASVSEESMVPMPMFEPTDQDLALSPKAYELPNLARKTQQASRTRSTDVIDLGSSSDVGEDGVMQKQDDYHHDQQGSSPVRNAAVGTHKMTGVSPERWYSPEIANSQSTAEEVTKVTSPLVHEDRTSSPELGHWEDSYLRHAPDVLDVMPMEAPGSTESNSASKKQNWLEQHRNGIGSVHHTGITQSQLELSSQKRTSETFAMELDISASPPKASASSTAPEEYSDARSSAIPETLTHIAESEQGGAARSGGGDSLLPQTLPFTPANSQPLANDPDTAAKAKTKTKTKTHDHSSRSVLPPTPQLTQAQSEISATPLEADIGIMSSVQQASAEVQDSPNGQLLAELGQSQGVEMETAGKSPAKTPARKSLSNRLSYVPDVISAWFSPKRAAGTTPQVGSSAEAGQEERVQTTLSRFQKSQPRPTQEQSASSPLASSSGGLTTSLGYYHSLSLISRLHNPSPPLPGANTVDVLAIVTDKPSPAVRARSGPRDFFILLRIADTSLPASETIRVEVYRPWRAKLPEAEAGDVVLLRNFAVKSRKHQSVLLSTETSAWCVWRYEDGNRTGEAREEEGKPNWARKVPDRPGGTTTMREEMKGPQVEFGEQEREQVRSLREWWLRLSGSGRGDEEQERNGQISHAAQELTARL